MSNENTVCIGESAVDMQGRIETNDCILDDIIVMDKEDNLIKKENIEKENFVNSLEEVGKSLIPRVLQIFSTKVICFSSLHADYKIGIARSP